MFPEGTLEQVEVRDSLHPGHFAFFVMKISWMWLSSQPTQQRWRQTRVCIGECVKTCVDGGRLGNGR